MVVDGHYGYKCIAALLGKPIILFYRSFSFLIYQHIYYLQVHLKDGCPIPMVDIISYTYCYPEAQTWFAFYANRT